MNITLLKMVSAVLTFGLAQQSNAQVVDTDGLFGRVPGDDMMPVPICELKPETCVPSFPIDGLFATKMLATPDHIDSTSLPPDTWSVVEQFATSPQAEWWVVDPNTAYWGKGYLWLINPKTLQEASHQNTALIYKPDDIVEICELFPVCGDGDGTTSLIESLNNFGYTNIWGEMAGRDPTIIALPYAKAYFDSGTLVVPANTQIWMGMNQ